jgi:ATP-dependent Clp protease ATP-binding subunit ClpA
MRIDDELKATLEFATEEARKRKHEYLTTEHLLYALCSEKRAVKILLNAGVEPNRLQKKLIHFFNDHLEALPLEEAGEPAQTIAFWRVIQRAVLQAQSAGNDILYRSDILASLFNEKESYAVDLLTQMGASKLSIVRYISHGEHKVSPQNKPPGDEYEDEIDENIESPLASYAVHLNERAKAGEIDPLIGRHDELQLIAQTLARRRKNNPLLVGEPGVGKTAIIEGLALAIENKQVSEVLKSAQIYSLDLGALLAGTKYRGQFEQRFKALLDELQEHPNAILFIDEFHNMVGAGTTTGSSVDAVSMLKPLMARGKLKCIASISHSEMSASLDRDGSLLRRFHPIDIDEPSVEDTIKIMNGLLPHYEKHHGVTFDKKALVAAAELSDRFLSDRRLPDKAIDIIDQAGAANQLLPPKTRVKKIREAQIEAVVSLMAKIPEQTVSSDDRAALKQVEPKLKAQIFGQDKAISTLSSAIKMARAGLRSPDKPMGSFLFAGPTGVGKTELSKQLAQTLGISFLRFDMSEYMEKHTVSRLIGAPPGYVGYDRGGLLTDAIRRTPHAVLLLDEIEKAHSDLFNVLLQAMDHATMTDNNGREADFRHVILIMTTNAGGREMTANEVGFNREEVVSDLQVKSAIEKVFSPEFRNRLDGWITFDSLSRETMRKIVDKFTDELGDQLKEKNVRLKLTEGGRKWLAEKGYDIKFGARPLSRLIRERLKQPLADEILFGCLKNGGLVTAKTAQGELVLSYTKKAGKRSISRKT